MTLVIDDDDNLQDTIGLMIEKEDFRPLRRIRSHAVFSKLFRNSSACI